MGGVGSLLRVNKTLYVGEINEETSLSFRRVAASAKDSQDDTGETPVSKVVRRHFSEWGEIEHVRVMIGRGTAFVTYKYEANAQFAKEAMMNQSLDHDETLNVRWATDDPRTNGSAKDENERKRQGEKRIASVEALKKELAEDYERLKDDPSINWDEYARAKRQRLAMTPDEIKKLDEENQRGWAEYQAEQKSQKTAAAAESAPPAPSALLSKDALKSLQSLRTKITAAPQAPSALSGVQAYDSDSD